MSAAAEAYQATVAAKSAHVEVLMRATDKKSPGLIDADHVDRGEMEMRCEEGVTNLVDASDVSCMFTWATGTNDGSISRLIALDGHVWSQNSVVKDPWADMGETGTEPYNYLKMLQFLTNELVTEEADRVTIQGNLDVAAASGKIPGIVAPVASGVGVETNTVTAILDRKGRVREFTISSVLEVDGSASQNTTRLTFSKYGSPIEITSPV